MRWHQVKFCTNMSYLISYSHDNIILSHFRWRIPFWIKRNLKFWWSLNIFGFNWFRMLALLCNHFTFNNAFRDILCVVFSSRHRYNLRLYNFTIWLNIHSLLTSNFYSINYLIIIRSFLNNSWLVAWFSIICCWFSRRGWKLSIIISKL